MNFRQVKVLLGKTTRRHYSTYFNQWPFPHSNIQNTNTVSLHPIFWTNFVKSLHCSEPTIWIIRGGGCGEEIHRINFFIREPLVQFFFLEELSGQFFFLESIRIIIFISPKWPILFFWSLMFRFISLETIRILFFFFFFFLFFFFLAMKCYMT